MGPRPSVDEVVSLERRLHDPALRADREEVGRLLHEDFTEVGASGRRWDRHSMIDFLAGEPAAIPEVSELSARALGQDAVLVTYVATTRDVEPRTSFRSSLWVIADGQWRLLFHQGTEIIESRP
jgi:ribonuclease HI